MNNSSKKSYESMVKEIREKLAILLLDSFDRLPEDFKKLDPKDRITSLLNCHATSYPLYSL